MPTKPEPSDTKCPLVAVDRRLEDVHQQWHEAERAYFDPDRFRISIQAAIQTLRTVTFILQKNKRLIPDFDSWYQEWRDRLGADPLMRWMVDARNKIEKQGDLEAHSYVRAEITASYLNNGPVIEIPAGLFGAQGALIKSIPDSDLGEHIRQSGTLRIQRRWVENTLPDYELLEAVAVAYGRIAELVYDAHTQLGLNHPQTTNIETGEAYPTGREGRLPCMIGHDEDRTLNISLATGEHLDFTEKSLELDFEKAQKATERYGVKPEDIFGKSTEYDQVLHSLFNTAKAMTEKDGHHSTILFLMKGGKPLRIIQFEAESHGQKYIFMRQLAHEVTKLDADAVIMIGEVWRAAYDPKQPYMRPAEASDREEFLVASMVRKEGDPLQLFATMVREDGDVSVGILETSTKGAVFIFSPIYEAWGRAIPDDWLKQPC